MRPFILLYALALLVRLALVALYPDPAYPDSYYYVEVARALAATGRLEVDFVWIFAEVGGRIPADPVLPVPSNAHWLPLSSLVQAPFVLLLGPTAAAAALPLALVGSLAAPLTYAIARDAGARPEVRWGAGILAAVPAAGTVFMPQPENFALLMPIVAATLWLAARGLRGRPWAYALAGLFVGLASLARNDGFILGSAVGLLFVWDRWRAWREGRPARIPWAAAAGCLALYLLVMGPWDARQLATFGALSPTSYAIWIRSFEEWNSITANPSLGSWLAQGPATILRTQALGLVAAIGQFTLVTLAVVLVPFLLVGAWVRRRSLDFRPWFLHAALTFLGAAVIYPVHVPGGAFIHSAVGLWPHAYILALEGIVVAVAWVAARRPAWDERVASRLFVGAITVFVAALGLFYALPVHASWAESRDPRVALGRELDRRGIGREERLLSIDAAGLKYFTGRGGAVTPDDPLDTIEAVARAYRTRWLVLERGDIVRALAPVLRGEDGPEWIGPLAWAVPDPDGGPPALALYPVCTTEGDARCGGTAAGS